MRYRVRVERRVVAHQACVVELDAPDEVAARNEAIYKATIIGGDWWKTQDMATDSYEAQDVEELG